MERRLLNAKEAAEYIGCSLWALNEMRRRGVVPFVKLPQLRVFYYEKSALDAWIMSLQTQPGQQVAGRLRVAK